MKNDRIKKLAAEAALLTLVAFPSLVVSGCKSAEKGDGAPPPAHVVQASDMNLITLDSKEAAKFKPVAADKVDLADELAARDPALRRPVLSQHCQLVCRDRGLVRHPGDRSIPEEPLQLQRRG